MSLTYNGTEINQTTDSITYNGNDVKEVTLDGVSVWKKITEKTLTKYLDYSVTYNCWIDSNGYDFSQSNSFKTISISVGDLSKIKSIEITGKSVCTGISSYKKTINFTKSNLDTLKQTVNFEVGEKAKEILTFSYNATTKILTISRGRGTEEYPDEQGLNRFEITATVKITYTPTS